MRSRDRIKTIRDHEGLKVTLRELGSGAVALIHARRQGQVPSHRLHSDVQEWRASIQIKARRSQSQDHGLASGLSGPEERSFAARERAISNSGWSDSERSRRREREDVDVVPRRGFKIRSHRGPARRREVPGRAISQRDFYVVEPIAAGKSADSMRGED